MTIGTHPWSDADTHFIQNVMVHSFFGIIFPTGQGVVAFCSAAIATCACAAYECKRKMRERERERDRVFIGNQREQLQKEPAQANARGR